MFHSADIDCLNSLVRFASIVRNRTCMSTSTPKMNTPARIGYARTSTVEQNLDAKVMALEAAG